MTDSSLRNKAINGVLWSAADRFSVQGVQFILGIILARLLSPTDYGMIGMLAIFFAISQTFVDSGFSTALIQKNKCTNEDFSSVFYINVLIGFVVYFTLYILAPLIESFFNTQGLALLTRVLGINIIISSLAVVQRAKLTIEIDFRTQTKASLISIVFGGAVGLTLAYNGYGVWALVFQSLIITIANTSLLWFFSSWKPAFVFSMSSARTLFSFGSKLLSTSLLNTIFKNIYFLVIGKFFSAQELGYYTRAQQLQKLPSENITGIIQRVTFPVMSSIKDDNRRLQSAARKFIKLSTFVTFPLMVGLMVLAEPLVRLILTEKWLPVVPLLQLFCMVGILYPIHSININLLLVKGLSGLVFKLEIIKKVIIIIGLIITVPIGIKALIMGQIIISILAFFINTFYSGKHINYNSWSQIKDIAPSLINSMILVIVVYIARGCVAPDIYKLLFGTISGILSYLIIAKIINGPELIEIKGILLTK